jgi:malate synthase
VTEDAAAAVIHLTQIWQWFHHQAALDDGRSVTNRQVEQFRDQEIVGIEPMARPREVDGGSLAQARHVLLPLTPSDTLAAVLTVPVYQTLLANARHLGSAAAQLT